MKKVIIDRATWARGENVPKVNANSLFNRGGTKCCLGFLCEQLMGITFVEPHEHSFPTDLRFSDAYGKLPEKLISDFTEEESEEARKLVLRGLEEAEEREYTARERAYWEDLFRGYHRWEILIGAVNDMEEISDKVRETVITIAFKELGVEVAFE